MAALNRVLPINQTTTLGHILIAELEVRAPLDLALTMPINIV